MAENSLIKGFVNLNNENDEKSFWDYDKLIISFSGTPISVIGGNNSSFVLRLNKNSKYGIEEIQLGFSGNTTITTLDYNEEPIYLKWEIGEKQKIIRFLTANDGIMHFYLKNPKNLNVASISGVTINIV